MKILSIDTASRICGVSILEDEKILCKLDEETNLTHSEKLMPMIKNCFNQTNFNISDIDLLVCDKGPRFIYRYKNWYSYYKSFYR